MIRCIQFLFLCNNRPKTFPKTGKFDIITCKAGYNAWQAREPIEERRPQNGKETERGTYVLKEDEKLGAVQIADDVVAMIASLAAAEVEGVSALVGNITNELMSRVGMKKLTKGVKVEVVDGVVSVDIAIVIEYGHNIPQTSRNVQNKVKAAIENMTGLEVADINIRIAGVNMQEENK